MVLVSISPRTKMFNQFQLVVVFELKLIKVISQFQSWTKCNGSFSQCQLSVTTFSQYKIQSTCMMQQFKNTVTVHYAMAKLSFSHQISSHNCAPIAVHYVIVHSVCYYLFLVIRLNHKVNIFQFLVIKLKVKVYIVWLQSLY